jgi:biopolymer transport protein ExbB
VSSPLSLMFSFFDQGGPVLYAVFIAAALLWAVIIERLWFFYRTRHQQTAELAKQWHARQDTVSASARQIRKAWLSRFKTQAEHSQILLGSLIGICPLLGLLGTVTGMIQVFDVLSATGTGNAREMAGGIAQATLPTMAGLVVALSGVYFRSRFQRLSQRAVQALSEQLPLMDNQTKGGVHG